MKWNVFYYNVNKKKIETFNIFDHSNFKKYVDELLKECNDKEEFEKALNMELMYYFWSKAEWEVIIAPWVGGDKEKEAKKIDVYKQVIANWDIFLDYVWSHKEK